MDLSLSSIKNILFKNQLIKGRLRFTATEIQKLYQSKLKNNKNIQNELDQEKKNVKSSLERIKKLKSKLKYCEETVQKAFHPSSKNISLIYKNIGNHDYIKARFYWQGQQREVQVGSIPIILDIMQNMSEHGYLKYFSMPKSNEMTWEIFKKKEYLIEAAKEIAAMKFQEYIIRKQLTDDSVSIKKSSFNKNKNGTMKQVSQEKNKRLEGIGKKKYEWYDKWRRDNL